MSDQDYLISAPPPPDLIEVPELLIAADPEIPSKIQNLTDKEIDSKDLCLSLEYARKALRVTSTLNKGSNVFKLKPHKPSPKVGLFKVEALRSAQAGKTYPLSISLSDTQGGKSNTVTLSVKVTRGAKAKRATKSSASTPTTILLLGAGLAGLIWIAAEVRKRR